MRDKLGTALGAFLRAMGVLHFVQPDQFEDLVPEALPGSAGAWNIGAGVAELAIGALVLLPRTRRLGAGLAVLLFLAVFPGNLKMAWDWRDRSATEQAIAYGRLPLQIPLILWAWKVRRRA